MASVAHQTAADLKDELNELLDKLFDDIVSLDGEELVSTRFEKIKAKIDELINRVERETENHVRSFAEGVDWH